MLAYEGHCDELKMIYGSSQEEDKSKVTKLNNAEDFIAAFSGRK